MIVDKFIVLDIETTGFDKVEDDILQISIINQDEEVLFNEYIRPEKKTAWPSAEAVHHISDAMVCEKPQLSSFKERLEDIFSSYEYVLTYNGDYFDLPFLKAKNLDLKNMISIDVMKEYTKKFGGKWRKLDQLSKELGFDEESFHDSLTDVRATLYVYKHM